MKVTTTRNYYVGTSLDFDYTFSGKERKTTIMVVNDMDEFTADMYDIKSVIARSKKEAVAKYIRLKGSSSHDPIAN